MQSAKVPAVLWTMSILNEPILTPHNFYLDILETKVSTITLFSFYRSLENLPKLKIFEKLLYISFVFNC